MAKKKNQKTKQQRRESPSGLHFYTLYADNARHWYLKYILGLVPRYTKPALIFGGAMHEAMAAFYQNIKDPKADEMLFDAFCKELNERKDEYEDPNQYQTDEQRGLSMLGCWYHDIGQYDGDDYEILEVEKQYETPLGPDDCFVFTARPDRALRSRKDGKVYVDDTKTTGWSLSKAIESHKRDSQMTSYIWTLRKHHPDWDLQGGRFDALFQRGATGKPQARRSEVIYRTEQELRLWEIQFVGLIIEVSQKVKALKEGIPWPLLFPIHYRIEALFGCEYEGICDREIKPGEIPPGFKLDSWSEDLDAVLERVGEYSLEDWKQS